MTSTISYMYSRLFDELGFTALGYIPHDVRIILAIRLFRAFVMGQAPALFLVHFLSSKSFDKLEIGLFMAAALIGNTVLFNACSHIIAARRRKQRVTTTQSESHVYTNTDTNNNNSTNNNNHNLSLLDHSAPGIVFHSRLVIQYHALGMAIAGATFALSSNYTVLLLAAIVGEIVPPLNDPFPSTTIPSYMEEYLQRYGISNHHPQGVDMVYMLHTVSPLLATAFGHLFGGWVVFWLAQRYDLSQADAYRLGFAIFAFFSVLMFLFSLLLTENIENISYRDIRSYQYQTKSYYSFENRNTLPEFSSNLSNENSPLVVSNQPTFSHSSIQSSAQTQSSNDTSSLYTNHSYNLKLGTRIYVWYLSSLISMNVFVSSLVSTPWITYYLSDRFQLTMPLLGSVLFAATSISALAAVFSKSLTSWLGSNLSFALSHFPAALFLMAFPMPSLFHYSFMFLTAWKFANMLGVFSQKRLVDAVLPYGNNGFIEFNDQSNDFQRDNHHYYNQQHNHNHGQQQQQQQNWESSIGSSYTHFPSPNQFMNNEAPEQETSEQNGHSRGASPYNKQSHQNQHQHEANFLTKDMLTMLYNERSSTFFKNMITPLGFIVSGYLASNDVFWEAFVFSGFLSIGYSVLLLATVEIRNWMMIVNKNKRDKKKKQLQRQENHV